MSGVAYNKLIYTLPQFVHTAGLNSEAAVSASWLERTVAEANAFPHLNSFLYLYDCQKLVASIQECNKEIDQILGEFYKVLNTEPLFYPPYPQPDGIRFNTSPTVTKLFSHLSFIFIRLHSLLDYSVKIAFEAENVRTDFNKYPRLASLNLQFGDRKRIKFNNTKGSVFEKASLIDTIETLRNHIIHDGLLDDMPKAYENVVGGQAIERFILLPDMTEGRFDRFKNRNLFFGAEDKINLRLPDLVDEFQRRLEVTVSKTTESLLRK